MLHSEFFLFWTYSFAQILYQENFTGSDFTDAQEWTVIGEAQIIGSCGLTKLFGGEKAFGKGTKITKLIQLPPHHALKVEFVFWKIDIWGYESDYFYLWLDQILVLKHTFSLSVTNINYCGNSGFQNREIVQPFSLIQDHNYQSVFILMTSNLIGNILNKSWGIRDFRIFIYPCPAGCLTCTSSDQRVQCVIWTIINQSLLNLNQNDFDMEGWIIDKGFKQSSSCLSIPILGGYNLVGRESIVKKYIKLPVHSQVKIKFRYIFIDQWNQECAQLLVDNQLKWDYSHTSPVEIANICGEQQGETLFNFEITLPHSQELIQLQFTSTLINSHSTSSFGIRDFQLFISCDFGYTFDQACGSFCGNGEKEGFEQCDDGNHYPFDGCFNCQYQCVEGCSNCIDGICIECYNGWTLNIIDLQCEPACGDRIITGMEECDLDLLEKQFRCNQCKFVCQKECLDCKFGQCYNCHVGWILDSYQCIYWEDHTKEKNCDQNCICVDDVCQHKCKSGFDYVNNECQTVCGDGIVAGNEVCELDIYYENQLCQNCLHLCSKNCEMCDEGLCFQCASGYRIDKSGKYCFDIVGNSVLKQNEECEDLNKENGDGCSSKGLIEENFVCESIDSSFTQCSYEEYPVFKISLIHQYFQYQYVSLHFDQLMKYNRENPFSQMIKMRLVNVNESLFSLRLIPIQEPTQVISEVQYIVEVAINTISSSPPILEVILEDQLYNKNEAPLRNQKNKIKLQLYQYIDEQQQQSANKLKNIATYIIVSLAGLGIFIQLFFGITQIFGTLEILQQQSYLRFINVIFPLNLLIFFESSNLISIDPILERIYFRTYLYNLIKEDYVESYEKFKFYQINSNLLSNIQTQIFLIIVLMISYYSSIFVINQIKRLDESKFFYFGLQFAQFLMKLQKKLCRIKKTIDKEGFQEFINTNSWDLLFMSYLQIQKKNRNAFANVIAFIILLLSLLISSNIFNKPSLKFITLKNFWLQKYQSINLLKKSLFIGIIVLFQHNQQIQTVLLTFVSQLYLIYLINIKPFKNKLDCINTLTLEMTTFIFCFTSFIYWSENVIKINYSTQLSFGWFQIGMLTSVLFINLFLQLTTTFLGIKKIVLKKWTKFKQKAKESNVFVNV